MNVDPEYTKAHEPSLIEDIAPPHAEQYTNADKEEVRRRSIGSLNTQYQRSKRKFKELKKDSSEPSRFTPKIVEPTNSSAKIKYSVMSPLPQASNSAKIPEKNRFTGQYKRLAESLNIAWLTVVGWFHAAALKMFPKRYTAESGMVVDWQAPVVSRMKIALPLVVVALLALTVLAARPNLPGVHNFNKQNSATSSSDSTNSASAQNSSDNPNPGNNPSPTMSAISPVAPVNTVTPAGVGGVASGQPQQSVTSPPSSSTPSVGGMGGGGNYNVQVPAPSPTPAPVNSVPPTNTVTVPPTQVQVGDKPVLQTNGTNLTIN
jgi:hypothetical protein